MLRLHIGGKQVHPDWKIIDIEEREGVDYVINANSLKMFADESVDMIYASHVLEHFYYNIDGELLSVLQEWRRVLKKGGKLLISVPDLRVLCWLYLHPHLHPLERHHVMRIMFGGQMNIYDVHKVGLDQDILGLYLQEAGFDNYEVVSEFNLFEDSSRLKILDTLISLNVIVTKS